MEYPARRERERVCSRKCSKSGYVKGNGFCASFPIETATSSWVFAIPGIGFRSVELIQEKMVVLAPIPSINVSSAAAVKPGDLPSCLRL